MLLLDEKGVTEMETIEDVIENAFATLTDEQIEQEVGIVTGRLAARAFAERLGEVYEDDSN